MKRLLSYLYPITKKIKSKYSDTLEITWYNGKKHLNTKNANYSYGSLQLILKVGLKQINLKTVENILVLGLGGGSVIETLRKDFNYKKQIYGVDIDPVIIDLAKEEFSLKTDQNLKIICQDAVDFLDETHLNFDLIIIDIFIDTEVPNFVLEEHFWTAILKTASAKHQIIFNAALHQNNDQKLASIISILNQNKYKTETLNKLNGTNTLLIAQRNHL
ncbi:fused MFS/spermidine synthase [Mesoflavibacter profundi]|uniref:fused MFS/spermidine synthase n=1 Tax=Mesoflavibacter profundi TaxID=2708110 RepID=UPI00168B0DF6|nr:fused MFS/spermidine synthase [Mesoflavibacter profundi]